jgi:hypothetical protein
LTIPVNIGSDHIQGSINNAPITLVEYGEQDTFHTLLAIFRQDLDSGILKHAPIGSIVLEQQFVHASE